MKQPLPTSSNSNVINRMLDSLSINPMNRPELKSIIEIYLFENAQIEIQKDKSSKIVKQIEQFCSQETADYIFTMIEGMRDIVQSFKLSSLDMLDQYMGIQKKLFQYQMLKLRGVKL